MVNEIQRLCQERNISLNKLEKDLGFSKSSIARWDINKPAVDKVQKVADFFHVSIEYLRGETNVPFPALEMGREELMARNRQTNPKIKIILRDLEDLSDDSLNLVMALIKTIKSQNI